MAVTLTKYEQEMLDGIHGEAKQLAMDILIKMAKTMDAKELIEVASVQAMAHFGSLHIAGRDWMEKLAGMHGKCCVPTYQDPASIPFDQWEEMGYDREYSENQLRLRDAIIKLGEYPTWSCTPYFQGSVPRLGQAVAWAESSAVIFANSVLGARTNRTPAGIAILAAITGRIPKFGLYEDENRVAKYRINVEAGELSSVDYNAIGCIVGRTVGGSTIPALYGIPQNATNDQLKYMGASMAAWGGVAMYHAVGVTPEALHDDPFHGNAPIGELTITREMLEDTKHNIMSTKAPGEIDLAVTGCPHSSMDECVQIAELFQGRKVKEGKGFWLFTTLENSNLLDRMGLRKPLIEAGVRIMSQTCLVISPLVGNYKSLITDSGKFASYLPSEHHVGLTYASLEECVEAVTEKAEE